MLDLAQTVVSLLALLVAVYAVIRQKREMAQSSKLNAATTLFDYYNAKISSLRKSIIRDSGGPELAELLPLAERQTRLKRLLKTHEKMLNDLERLYDRMPSHDKD